MSWVYPIDQAGATARLGVDRGFVWLAGMFLLGGVAEVIIRDLLWSTPVPWIALLGLCGFWLTVLVARTWNRMPLAIRAVVLLSTVGLGWLVGVGVAHGDPVAKVSVYAAMIAGAATGALLDHWSGAAGTLLGGLGSMVGLLLGGHPFELSVFAFGLWIALYYALLVLTARRNRATTVRLDAAGRESLAVTERHALELRSRSLVHDTVLSELVALGAMRPGPLSERVRSSIITSLALAAAPFDEERPVIEADVAIDELATRLGEAGLSLTVNGDLSALARLSGAQRSVALNAIDQSLTNVLRHSGTDHAELSVLHSGPSLVITIVDDGVGFDESTVPADRFGLRDSIRGRVAQVGGEVRVLSKPGFGTSVVIRIPIGDPA